MKEEYPMYIYWVAGIMVTLANLAWIHRLKINFFVKAAINGIISSIFLIVLHVILDGQLSNLAPAAFIFFGIPLFLLSCLCQLIIKFMIDRKYKAVKTE